MVVSYPSRWHCISLPSRPSFYTLPSFLIPPHVFNAFGPQLATRPYQFYIRRLQMLLAIKPPHSRATHTASTDACLFLGRSPSPLPYICTYFFTLLLLVHGFTSKLAKPICITYSARRYAVLKDFSHSQIETPLMLGLTAPAGCTSIRCPDKTS